MEDRPILLHIDLETESIEGWLTKNEYIIFSELIRFSEKLIIEKLDTIQAIMVSNIYDNIVFILKKDNLDLTLNKAMDYFMSIEEFEKCAKIRDLYILIENLKNETEYIKVSKPNQRKPKVNR